MQPALLTRRINVSVNMCKTFSKELVETKAQLKKKEEKVNM